MVSPGRTSEQLQAPEDGAEVSEVPLIRTGKSQPSIREAVCTLFWNPWNPGELACGQMVMCRTTCCLEPVPQSGYDYEPQSRPVAVHALPIKRRVPSAESQGTDLPTPDRLQSKGDAPIPGSISRKEDARDADLLVPLVIARGFVCALEKRYLGDDDGAVDTYLQSLQEMPNVSIFHEAEKVVRKSRNPAQTIAKLVGKWGLEETAEVPREHSSIGDTDLLVPLDIARGFVTALEERYLGEHEIAVDKFLQSLPPLPHVNILHQAEEVVRRSRRPAKTIAKLVEKWGLAETSEVTADFFGKVLPLHTSDEASAAGDLQRKGLKNDATPVASLPVEEGQSFLAWSAPRTISVASEELFLHQSDRFVATPLRNGSGSDGSTYVASFLPVQTGEGKTRACTAPRTASVASEDLPDLFGQHRAIIESSPCSYQRRDRQRRASSGDPSGSPSRSLSRTPSRRGSSTPSRRGPGSLGPLDVVFDFVGNQMQDIKRGPSFIQRSVD
eukprot:TRINITY_DN42666_c0_g1_i1.p1 TRINITY_DN42666_c0_g1~~TRINITY_DN42666_c0_g1_i1.p1  ORF type:complete len:516 (-),score=56.13 TRINITY_DN42666_c0_g1_i1:117-1613(-)